MAVSGWIDTRPNSQLWPVLCINASGASVNGLLLYSGQLQVPDASQVSGSQYRNNELVWIFNGNLYGLVAGKRYVGQFAGYSPSYSGIAVYAVTAGGFTGTKTVLTSGACLSGGNLSLTTEQWYYEDGVFLSGG